MASFVAVLHLGAEEATSTPGVIGPAPASRSGSRGQARRWALDPQVILDLADASDRGGEAEGFLGVSGAVDRPCEDGCPAPDLDGNASAVKPASPLDHLTHPAGREGVEGGGVARVGQGIGKSGRPAGKRVMGHRRL